MLTLVVFAALGTGAVVIYRNATREGAGNSTALQGNAESRAVVAQDQAPQTGPLGGAPPRVALERAIAADMRRRIRRNELSGPLRESSCTATGARRATKRAFRCNVRAGDVDYPFLGVVDLGARRIIWCKRDPPPSPELDVPVSRRCRG